MKRNEGQSFEDYQAGRRVINKQEKDARRGILVHTGGTLDRGRNKQKAQLRLEKEAKKKARRVAKRRKEA